MEAEMRAILEAAVRGPGEEQWLLAALHERVAQLGGVELDLPPRSAEPRAPDLSA